MQKRVLALVFLMLVSVVSLSADIIVDMNYNVGYGQEWTKDSFVFGAGFKFWGIFTFSASNYTTITFDPNSFMGIREINPLGLMSMGFGMDIPMGGFSLIMDWQKLYAFGNAALVDYSQSFKIGASFMVNDYLAFQFYNRRLYDFVGPVSSFTPDSGAIDLMGFGLMFYFD
jgi:hypothetical protein